MKQLLALAQSDYNVMIEWLVVFKHLILGIGASATPVTRFVDEIEDTDSDNDIVVVIVSFFWIFNVIYVMKRDEKMSMHSVGIGLKPLTPMLIIGWKK